MKFLSGLLLIFILSNSCEQKETFKTISYEAITRGASYKLKIKDNELIVENSREENSASNIQLTAEDLNELYKLVGDFRAKTTDNIVLQADKSAYDAAMRVNFILAGEHFSQSAEFDQGNAPESLKPLIDKLMELAKK
ncbi:MAG: hypothetical protein V7767_02800 [Leeuwenhoekiella sp.]